MSGKSTGLGRGFDSLLPQDFDTSVLIDDSDKIKKISLSKITPNPNQPRKHFSEEALKGLAQSIKRYGIVQPLVLTPASGDRYAIIAGERRYRASKIAGINHVPAIIRTAKDLEQLEIALIENVQRVDLSPLEQGLSVVRLREQFNLSEDEIAKRLGKAKSTISNLARLLHLSKNGQKALNEGQITEGHARSLLALKTEDRQDELLKLIIKNGWNVRQAERYVTAKKQGLKDPTQIKKRVSNNTPETQKLGKMLRTEVSIKRMAKGGKLEIRFKSDEDLNRLIKELSS
jgi:ParB family transcriptional regulator, chromosome partitioning protein